MVLKHLATCELCGVDFSVDLDKGSCSYASGYSLKFEAPQSRSEEDVDYACQSCSDFVTNAVQNAIMAMQAKKGKK
jgi:hypothetical protein